MKCSVITMILALVRISQAFTTCGLEDLKKVQEMFSNCTTKYKTDYNMAVSVKKEEAQKVTCRLVENIVETCGDEWRQCHGVEDVRMMKDMHVESLLLKNRGVVVDIEQSSSSGNCSYPYHTKGG